jgi:hypothetical protein
MNKERLLKLCDLLDTIDDDKFDYSSFVDGPHLGACGTTACALGWATAIPEFGELGLCLMWNPYSKSMQPGISRRPNVEPREAAELIFGVAGDQFTELFIPRLAEFDYDGDEILDETPDEPNEDNRLGTEATSKGVAAHIRRMVAAHE